MTSYPEVLARIETLKVIVGDESINHVYHLRHEIKSEETLRAFQQGRINPWTDENTSRTSFLVKLPSSEALIFPLVIRWLNGQDLSVAHLLETEQCIQDDLVSPWCTLHVLAERFSIPALADEALSRYRDCRAPYWEGTWLPLESEIEYMYRQNTHSIRLRSFVVSHFVAEHFDAWSKGDTRALAALAASNANFNHDLLRAYREHLKMGVYPSDFCGVQDCLVHCQLTSSDVNSLERAPSTTPEPAQSDVVNFDQISTEEEEAMAAIEESEVVDEVRDLLRIQCLDEVNELQIRGASHA
ncbi:hypothetical protein DL98DRAFT_531706 [Cadophora sp. DSE1049]|nr:hypothetical protein DL98DRAFT_531706 [Cadophora sp. DSE1049]